jgi:hypothetical protein
MASFDLISEFTTRSNSSYDSFIKKPTCKDNSYTISRKLVSNHRRTCTHTASDFAVLSTKFQNTSNPSSPIRRATVPNSSAQTPQKIPFTSRTDLSSLSVSFANKRCTPDSLSSESCTSTRRKKHFLKFLDTAIEYFKFEIEEAKPFEADIPRMKLNIHTLHKKQKEVEEENLRLMQDYSKLKAKLQEIEEESEFYSSSVLQLSDYAHLLEQKLESTKAELKFQKRIGKELIMTKSSKITDSSSGSARVSKVFSSTDFTADEGEDELSEIASIIQHKEEEIQILKKHYRYLASLKERPSVRTLSHNKSLF